MNSGDITGIAVVGLVASTISWNIWVFSTNSRRRQVSRDVADLHARILDKCAANQELLKYVESEPGRRFLESAATYDSNPLDRILYAIQSGTILFLLGVAGLLIRQMDDDPDVRRILLVLGSGALAIGIGFLISAATSYFLCRSWGVLKTSRGESL